MPIINNTKDWEKVFRRQVREIAEGWTVRLSPRSNKITLKVRRLDCSLSSGRESC